VRGGEACLDAAPRGLAEARLGTVHPRDAAAQRARDAPRALGVGGQHGAREACGGGQRVHKVSARTQRVWLVRGGGRGASD
jgi:hypothetical protein